MAQFQSFFFQDDKNKNVFGFIRMNWLLSSRDIYVIQRYDPCTIFIPNPPLYPPVLLNALCPSSTWFVL